VRGAIKVTKNVSGDKLFFKCVPPKSCQKVLEIFTASWEAMSMRDALVSQGAGATRCGMLPTNMDTAHASSTDIWVTCGYPDALGLWKDV